MLAELARGAAGDLLRHRGEQLLGEVHQRLVVHVCPVELEHRELGVVLCGDALVAEVAVDLEHAVDAAHDQPLQIQLGRDAQVQLDVERVVVGDERPRQGAAGDRLHHRRLDFEEAARREELADRRHRAAARLEGLPHLGIHGQVEVALAVPRLDVLQAVPLLRQRQQALGEERQRRRPDRELVGLGAEQVAADADVIAEIEQPRECEVPFRQGVLPHVDLQSHPAVRQHQERGLAEAADADDAAGRRGVDPGLLERLGRRRRVRVDQLADAVRGVEPVRIRLESQGLDGGQVGATLFELRFFVGGHRGLSLPGRATTASGAAVSR